MTSNCSDSRIYVRDDNAVSSNTKEIVFWNLKKYFQWHQLPIAFGDGIRFPLQTELPFPLDEIPFSIKIADYNLDGFPDMVTVMKQRLFYFSRILFLTWFDFSSTNNTISIILKNEACAGGTTACTYNRTFTPKEEETFVSAITNATLAVFFDVLENVKSLKWFDLQLDLRV